MALVRDSSHPDGVYDDAGHDTGTQVVRARDRKANAAIQMSIEHHTWDEIAEVLGYPTARHAQLATERALEKRAADSLSPKVLRQIASGRLEALTKSVWAKATDEDHPEHLPAVSKARDLISDWVKLHGAAAPQELMVHSPSEGEIDEFVGRLVAKQVPMLEEDDIFAGDEDTVEAEIVEEDP